MDPVTVREDDSKGKRPKIDNKNKKKKKSKGKEPAEPRHRAKKKPKKRSGQFIRAVGEIHFRFKWKQAIDMSAAITHEEFGEQLDDWWASHGSKKLTWFFGQVEIGEKEKSPHFQWGARAKSKLRENQWQAVLDPIAGEPGHVWAECARGSVEEIKTYCSKEDGRCMGPWEFGETPVEERSRTDLKEMAMKLSSGAKLNELLAADKDGSVTSTFIRYSAGLRQAESVHQGLRAREYSTYPRLSIWVHGRSGHGKSTLCENVLMAAKRPSATIATPTGGRSWCDGATDDTEILVLDDFRVRTGSSGAGHTLAWTLDVLGDQHKRLEIKGSTVEHNSYFNIVTSILPPEEIGLQADGEAGIDEARTQLTRRVACVIKCEKEGDRFSISVDERKDHGAWSHPALAKAIPRIRKWIATAVERCRSGQLPAARVIEIPESGDEADEEDLAGPADPA